ncbi:hypothetical protein Dimus_030791 [Dionaea muscipula]
MTGGEDNGGGCTASSSPTAPWSSIANLLESHCFVTAGSTRSGKERHRLTLIWRFFGVLWRVVAATSGFGWCPAACGW